MEKNFSKPFVMLLLCFVYIAGIVFCICFAGCASTAGRTEPVIIEHQQEIDRAQGRIDYLAGRIDAAQESVDAIRARAEGIGGDIDEIISLFDEYQRRVEQLLRYYQDLRDAVAPREEDRAYIPAHSYFIDYGKINRNGLVFEGYQSPSLAGYNFIAKVPVTWLNYPF